MVNRRSSIVGRLGLVDGPNLTAAIEPAVRTGTMRWFRLMTMRALTGLCGRQRIMRPPLGRPRFRVPPLGIGHGVILVFVDRRFVIFFTFYFLLLTSYFLLL